MTPPIRPRALVSSSPRNTPVSCQRLSITTRCGPRRSHITTAVTNSPRPTFCTTSIIRPYEYSTRQSPHLSARTFATGTESSPPSRPKQAKTALFFPGHGVQRVGMADEWLAAFPKTCAPFLEETDSILNYPLSKLISEGPNSTLNATEHSQPAIMAVSIMVLRVLEQEFGFDLDKNVDVTLGHSLGEFAAVIAGGYFSFEQALRIVRRRGEAMAECTRAASKRDNGAEMGMIALVVEPNRLADLIAATEEFLGHRANRGADNNQDYDVEDVDAQGPRGLNGMGQGKSHADTHRPTIEGVTLANVNSKNQIVLSGSIERIQALLVQLRQFGGHDPRAVRLRAESPFHSPMMANARVVMEDMLEEEEVRWPGRFPIVSNVTSRPVESERELKEVLARQCVETVRWWDSIRYVDQEMGARRWLGVGPGKVGRNLVGKEVGMKGHDVVRGGGVWGISKPSEITEFLTGWEKAKDAE